jgi:hypothetical protein
MANMKLTTRTVLMTLMLAASASAMAAPHLTPRECNDYPALLKTEWVTAFSGHAS